MNSQLIESIANAVLYEGYMLYPYRPSSVKNRQRWNFGVVYPKKYSEMQKGTDACFMQTQCMIRDRASAIEDTILDIRIRFLHAISRQIGKLSEPVFEDTNTCAADFEIVDSIEICGKRLQSWQETMERDVILPPIRLVDLLNAPIEHRFKFSGALDLEPVKDDVGATAAYIVRTREAICGAVQIQAERCSNGLAKLTVAISNLTSLDSPVTLSREEVLLRSFVSTHTILGVSGGDFISLIDPETEYREWVTECKNIGTWPVLVGEDASKNAMLSSPIILYDYPQIAPESPGDLFDGTEIDEILSLRILTLSDDEKNEIRQSGDHARDILERTENMPPEHFVKLHGVLRGMKPPGGAATTSGSSNEIQNPEEER